jgi:NAD-dependent dihydropyrimidine dehydrogenase PreA subunit
MQIKIDAGKCNGCGVCADICPVDVFRVNAETRLAESRYETDCWYCGACEGECPVQAITVRLPYLLP